MVTNSNQDLIESLNQQRQGVKKQLEAVTNALLAASGSERVRLEADRDNLVNQLQEIDQRLGSLRQQVESDALRALIAILKPFTNDPRSLIAAYQRALLGRIIPPDLSDVESLVRHLVGDLQESSANRTLYRFVVYLICLSDQLKLPVSVINDLKQWVKTSIPELELVAIQAEIESEQDKQKKQKSCLLIKIYSSGGDEYHVKAWYINDRSNYRQHWPDGAKPVILSRALDDVKTNLEENIKAEEAQAKPENTISCSELEIKGVIQQIHQQCREQHAPPNLVEIFLPWPLMNSEIDSWRVQEDKPRPLFGTCYPVLLRSSDRLTAKYWRKAVHQQKWEAVERLLDLKRVAMPTFCEGDPSDIDELYVQVETYSVPDKPKTKDVVGLKLTQPLSLAGDEVDDLFETALMESALPIMIWARHLEEGLECVTSINQVLDCVLAQLPEDLKIHRLEAFKKRRKKQGCHIGNHLSLLWDDPQLLPPDSK